MDIPGSILTMIEQNRLVHAICLEGDTEPAVDIARQIAGAVLCERQQGVMCGECTPCRKVLADVHIDITRQSPEDGGYKKDALRTLRSEIFRSPHEGRAKVMILRDAQLMSHEVQNLLLNVMEEPPDDTYFILICDNRYRLLSTVLSRMVSVTLPQRSDEELLGELLASDTGRAAEQIIDAMNNGGGYKLLVTLQGCEKNRADYTATLNAADRLLGYAELRRRMGISVQHCLRLRKAIADAVARNEINGYLPIISASLAEQVSRR